MKEQETMDITQDKLKEIILKVLQNLQLNSREGGAADTPVSLPSAYVVCEAGRGQALLDFLKNCKNMLSGYRVTVVLEKPDSSISSEVISGELCHAVIGPDEATDAGVSVTYYPAFSRSALCEAGLGMDTLFSSAFLRRDFEAGRRSVILTGGLDPFTGREPEAYREMILSYVRNLIRMGVRFTKGEEVPAPSPAAVSTGKADPGTKGNAAAPLPEKAVYTLKAENNLVTANEVRTIPRGSTVLLPAGKVLTPIAKDVIRERNFRVIHA